MSPKPTTAHRPAGFPPLRLVTYAPVPAELLRLTVTRRGKGGGLTTGTGSPETDRPDGVVLISVWFFVNAFIGLVGIAAIAIFALPAVITDTAGSDRYFAIAGVSFALFLLVVFALLDIAAAIGLLRLRQWARWLAIVLAALGLLMFPIGTIVGILIIWYLLQDEAKHAFGAAPLPPMDEKSIKAA